MKTVSILGCGWLGTPLAISLLNDGYSVKGSTTKEAKLDILQINNIEPYIVNISDFEEYDDFLHSDILIIAITSKDIDGFESLISQIVNSDIQKVIFISSTSVYPRVNKIMTEEDEVITNHSLIEIESLFRENIFFESTIIRFAGLFDDQRHPSNWFKKGRKIPQPKGFVNMIHKDECINIIHEVIDKNAWNQTFNACSNHHPTRREFYTLAKVANGFEIPEFDANEELQWKVISSNKVQNMLNYTFIHDDLLSI